MGGEEKGKRKKKEKGRGLGEDMKVRERGKKRWGGEKVEEKEGGEGKERKSEGRKINPGDQVRGEKLGWERRGCRGKNGKRR